MKRSAEEFDLEAIYDEKVYPLMAQIIEVCKENRLPVFTTFLYGRRGDKCDYCSTFLSFNRASDEMEACRSMIQSGLVAMAVSRRNKS